MAACAVAQHCGLQSSAGFRRTGSVPVDVVCGSLGGAAGAEVGAVAGEDVDPLAASIVDGLGDEVSGVAVSATGHGDVRRRGAGRLSERECLLVGARVTAPLGTKLAWSESHTDIIVDGMSAQRSAF